MSEEEKEAIEKFENLLKKHFEDKKIDTVDYLDYFEGITILNLIESQQKEIEDIRRIGLYNKGFDNGVKYVKNEIKEKLEEIRKGYNNIISNDNVSLDCKNINSHRFDAMSRVLEELLKGIKTNE